ncbi:MAG: hypothetical protein NVSMB32_02580 [Actinomycetota bacterium]
MVLAMTSCWKVTSPACRSDMWAMRSGTLEYDIVSTLRSRVALGGLPDVANRGLQPIPRAVG